MSRVDKVAEEIRREVSRILQQEMNDPRVGFTTVTRVELTPDLRFARIFYSVYGSEKQWEDTQEGLTHAIPFIRRLIGERVQLRFVPEILFKSDHSAEYSIRVEEELQALRSVEVTPKKKRKVSDGSKKPVRRAAKKRK